MAKQSIDELFEDAKRSKQEARKNRDSNSAPSGETVVERTESERTDPRQFFGSVEREAIGSAGEGATFGATSDGGEYQRDESGQIVRNKDGSPRKKRGRKAGSKRVTKKENEDLVGLLSKTLYAVHLGIAGVSQVPECKITEQEADSLAECFGRLQEAYGVNVDPRTAALVSLGSTMAAIYGPRYVIYQMRTNAPKENTGGAPGNAAPARKAKTSRTADINEQIKAAQANAATPSQMYGGRGGATSG